MKAMILAAGQGTRLAPLTASLPKCMIPIGGMPVLEHTLIRLRGHDIIEVIINLRHQPDVIPAYFGDGSRWGVRITYSLEEEFLGTAGGVKQAAWFFDGPFLVLYGDNLSTCNLSRLARRHGRRDSMATIALYRRDDPSSSGIADVDAKDRIIRFVEKPRLEEVFSNWVNAGIYVLNPEILDLIPTGQPNDFGRDVFPHMLAEGRALYGYRMQGDESLWWIDTPDDLARVQRAFEYDKLEEEG
ncbi:MAG: NDP-sugar synthase [Anaerolineales bacterium]